MKDSSENKVNSILLNIGIERSDKIRDIATVDVRLYRAMEDNYNLEEEDYGVESLEATELPLVVEQWKSSNGVMSTECLCTLLEIESAWSGPVRLEVSTDKGFFAADAHLHDGANSFFFSADRLQKPVSEKKGKKLKYILAVIGVCFLGTVLGCGLYFYINSLGDGDEKVVATDSVNDSVMNINDSAVEEVEERNDIPQQTESHNVAFPTGRAPEITRQEPAIDTASAVDEENKPEPPRKENNYGIEE